MPRYLCILHFPSGIQQLENVAIVKSDDIVTAAKAAKLLFNTTASEKLHVFPISTLPDEYVFFDNY